MAFRRIHKDSLAGSPGYILGEYNVTNIPTILYNFLKVKTVIVLKTGAEICKSFSVRERTAALLTLGLKTLLNV